jgi:hypothetical protein
MKRVERVKDADVRGFCAQGIVGAGGIIRTSIASSRAAGSPLTGRAGSHVAPGSSCRCASSRVCSVDCFLSALRQAFDAGDLRFGGSVAALVNPTAFAHHLAPAAQTEWVVYAKRPFAGPDQVLDYVGRYTHRDAISNERLLDVDEDRVRFRYKDYRGDSVVKIKTMTLSALEFIRRFLLHVLPRGFHRVRYYGFLGNRVRRGKLARCRALLQMPAPSPPQERSGTADRYQVLTGESLRLCPMCAEGHMHVIERFPRPRPPFTNTS